jgi:hypothetical protein
VDVHFARHIEDITSLWGGPGNVVSRGNIDPRLHFGPGDITIVMVRYTDPVAQKEKFTINETGQIVQLSRANARSIKHCEPFFCV